MAGVISKKLTQGLKPNHTVKVGLSESVMHSVRDTNNIYFIPAVQSSPSASETTNSESEADDGDVSESAVTESSAVVVTEESVLYFEEKRPESIILSTIETFTLGHGKYDCEKF